MIETTPEQSEANRARFAVAFERAFSLLAHPDAVAAGLTAFILDQDPQTDVALLSNPVFLQHATTVSIAKSEIEVDGNHGGILDSELTIDFMLIPCRVQGTLSYGCVGRRLYGTMASCARDAAVLVHNIAMGRYVRNEANGEMLIVAHTYEDENGRDGMSVVHTRFEGTTRQTSFRAVFNPAEFEDAQVGPVAAVRRAADANFTRFCPVCRASPHSKCSCVLPYMLPSGPTDLGAVALNSRHTIGDWLGRSVSTIHCPTYFRYASANVMTRCSTRTPLATIPLALHEGILQARLATASPARSVIPSMYDAVMARASNADFAFVDMNISSAAILGDLPMPVAGEARITRGNLEGDAASAADIDQLPAFVLDGECDAAIDCCGGDDARGNPMALPLLSPNISMDRELLHGFVLPGDFAASEVGHVSSPISDEESVARHPPAPLTARAEQVDDPAGLMMTALLSQNPELAALSVSGSSSSWAHYTFAPTATASASSNEQENPKSKASKRRKTPTPRRDSPEKTRDSADAADAAARHAARVAKNRAAARVSNARRKERNLTLRRDLAVFRDRLKDLRDRESLLRDENSKLRRLISP
jgi:hypothetical protein